MQTAHVLSCQHHAKALFQPLMKKQSSSSHCDAALHFGICTSPEYRLCKTDLLLMQQPVSTRTFACTPSVPQLLSRQ
jgi:hypothetical protein